MKFPTRYVKPLTFSPSLQLFLDKDLVEFYFVSIFPFITLLLVFVRDRSTELNGMYPLLKIQFIRQILCFSEALVRLLGIMVLICAFSSLYGVAS